MFKEIERKFLITGDFKPHAASSIRIKQGYLSSVPERTVRIRITGDKAYITVKGIGEEGGVSRFELEKEISVSDAEALLKICEENTIDKTRYYIPAGNHTYEVDEFYGDNEGLVVAEIELSSVEEPYEKPDWLGQEVTGDDKYYNVMLLKNPYKNWTK